MHIYFSDYFNINKQDMEDYGIFNISLINDLPVFIDPFLLFTSEKKEYQKLHDDIIKYITFLRDISQDGELRKGMLKHLFLFPEVKQNWLGYSKTGNRGAGLGIKFATALNDSFGNIFSNFGSEEIPKSSHLEKLCLIKSDVGRDNISDFTTNLIKGYLCEYTQTFSKKFIDKKMLKKVYVPHSFFDYKTRTWRDKEYVLPYLDNDYIILSPKDILTKDDTWINRHDLIANFSSIRSSISNEELRDQINDYFLRALPKRPKPNDFTTATELTIRKYPEVIDYYIKQKEDTGNKAKELSQYKIQETENIFIKKIYDFMKTLEENVKFTETKWDTFEETLERILFLKQVIENNDGYKIFYIKGEPVKREADLQLMFRLTWFATPSDVNGEVNNGRGPVDYKISRGFKDKTLVEFKLASNSKLKQNLAKQVEVYKSANQTKKAIKVILFFDNSELAKTNKILKELDLEEGKNIILIDARKKISASNVTL